MASEAEGARQRSALWIVSLLALCGLLCALLLSALVPRKYESLARITILNPPGSLADEAALIESPQLGRIVSDRLGYDADVEAEPLGDQEIVTIRTVAGSPERAAEFATSIALVYEEFQIGAAMSLIQPGTLDDAPVAPNVPVYLVLGTLAGAVIGLGAAASLAIGRRRLAPDIPTVPAPQRPSVSTTPIPNRSAVGPVERSPEAARLAAPAARLAAPAARLADTAGAGTATADRSAMIDLRTESRTRVAGEDPNDPAATIEYTSAPALVGSGGETPAASPDSPVWRSSSDESAQSDRTPTWSPASSAEPRPAPRPNDAGSQARSRTRDEDDAADPPQRPPSPDWAPEASEEGTDVEPPQTDLDSDLDSSTQKARAEAPTPTVAVAGSDLDEPVFDSSAAVRDPAELERLMEAANQRHQTALAELQAAANLEVQAAAARHKAEVGELELDHDQALAAAEKRHDRELKEVRAELASTRKDLRMTIVKLKRERGNDETRVGDLEAQLAAAVAEADRLRELVEAERSAHVARLGEERERGDRALDNARTKFQDELRKYDRRQRATMATARVDLDGELAAARTAHQTQLETAHEAYEEKLATERKRLTAQIATIQKRHRAELAAAADHEQQELVRQADQHKQTIAELRAANASAAEELDELSSSLTRLRRELARTRKRSHTDRGDHERALQTARDEVAMARAELAAEKDRSAALREDLLRLRTEANARVDRVLEERAVRMGELEKSLERQRSQTEQRISAALSDAEERIRDAAAREAELSATISRLQRQLEERQIGFM